MTISEERHEQPRSASSVERQMLTDGRGTADDFPDPFGEHDIEWWVWDGERFIPAPAEEILDIEEYERARAARRQLAAMERAQGTLWWRVKQQLTVVVQAMWVVRFWRRCGSSPHESSSQQPTLSERVGRTT